MDTEHILSDPDLKNIYDKMLDYLSKNDMAEARLVDRVHRLQLRYPRSERYRRYSKENCRVVIPLLREEGYVDDERYARRVFDSLKDKRDGLRMIRQKMLRRQIKVTVVDELLKKFSEAVRQDLTKITEAARKKLHQLRDKYASDPVKKFQIRQKVYAWLAMKGYSSEETASISRKIF
ncbi:MAG: RecX family transcriptional regulator [Patescibacteria group bacterium]